MKVPYLDLPAQFKDQALLEVLRGQLDSCRFILGPEVERFEADFAALCGTDHALGLNSGTDAIFLALKAMGVGEGDEVITAPNSFVATTGAVVAAGARPVFVDVGADYNIDVGLIEPAIGSRTRAILPVHLTGSAADMPAIIEIARRHDLRVVEDAAQAVAATIDGKAVGCLGDVGAFSLHPLKNLNVCGDGGVVTTNDDGLFERMKLLRNHGLRNRDEIELFGYNSRLDNMQAAVARHVMKSLAEVIDRRRHNAGLYDELLAGLGEYVTIPPRRANARHVFHTYVVMVRDRGRLCRHLAERGVDTKVHYPVPIHLQKPCRAMGYKRGDFPQAERQAESIVSLPVHQHLSDEQVRYVCEAIGEFYHGGAA